MLEKALDLPIESNLQPEFVVEQRTVRGNVARGQRPHVCIDRVKYTNALLTSMPTAIGRRLQVRIDPRDMRSVHGHFENGEDIGILVAIGVWSSHPHTRAVRKAINQMMARQAMKTPQTGDPVNEWIRSRQREVVAKANEQYVPLNARALR